MRSGFASLTAVSILVAGAAVPSIFPSAALAASPSVDERDILAQCETSFDEGPKLITNIAPISIPKSLTTPRDVRAEVERRAADTMRKVGMSNRQHAGCGFFDPSMPWTDGNNPQEELAHFHQILEGQGYRSVHVDRLDEATNAPPAELPASASMEPQTIYECHYEEAVHSEPYAVVVSNLSQPDLQAKWSAWVQRHFGNKGYVSATCSDRSGWIPNTSWDGTRFDSPDSVDRYYAAARAYNGWTFRKIEWSPEVNYAEEMPADSGLGVSQRKKKRVFFRSPHDDGRGYTGVDFDVEYQFLVCSGELHIAYSLVQDSVRVGDWPPGSGATAHYTYKGHFYQVESVPTHVENVPLKGKVWFDHDQDPLGTFGDDFAGPALGFGCFSGQTKKIADMKDLAGRLGDHPDQEAIAKLLDQLNVSFETNEILTSETAEEEIRAGIAKKAAENDEHIGTGAGDEVVRELEGKKAAEERAARRAAEEAEFQAKQKAYEEGMAAHQAAVEQYQKALADNEAQKAANVAAAKAQQEEFARKQAEYEAELARAKQAQDEYEAKYGKPQ